MVRTALSDVRIGLDSRPLGAELHDRIRRLYPICRSITGNGVRETLRILGEEIPIQTEEIPSGTRVFDWTIPKEWNIRGRVHQGQPRHACRRFQRVESPRRELQRASTRDDDALELRPHLHSIPEHPDWIPYKTSYYAESWGFCLPHRQLDEIAAKTNTRSVLTPRCRMAI